MRVEAEIKKWGNSLALRVIGIMAEVPIANLDEPSVVAANLVQTLSRRERKAEKIVTAKPEEFRETLLRLLPLVGALEVLGD